MNDDDVMMTSSSCGSSSRGSGSRDGGDAKKKKKKRTTKKEKYLDDAAASATTRTIVSLDERIKYIEFIDGIGGEVDRDVDEITTFASSTSSSSSMRRNQSINMMGQCSRSGREPNHHHHQQQQQQQQKKKRHLVPSLRHDRNVQQSWQQLGQQHPQVDYPNNEGGNDNNDSDNDNNNNDRPNGNNIPRNVNHHHHPSSSHNHASHTGSKNYNGNQDEKDDDDDDDDDEREYYCDGTIPRRREMTKKNDSQLLEKRTNIHHRCQKVFGSWCCNCFYSVRKLLASYFLLDDDVGIIFHPIMALSCGFVCLAVVMTIGVWIVMSVSQHVISQNNVVSAGEQGGGGGVDGASHALGLAEVASMSNTDRLILAERIDRICDKLGNEWSSEDGGDGGGGECWSLCHEKRCCFAEEGTRRQLSETATTKDTRSIISRRRMRRRRGHDAYGHKQYHVPRRRLQLAHSNIPGENDFTYIAHKVYGSNTDSASGTATTASAESVVVTSEEEEGGGMDNCANDPDEFCMVYAGCAPLFGK